MDMFEQMYLIRYWNQSYIVWCNAIKSTHAVSNFVARLPIDYSIQNLVARAFLHQYHQKHFRKMEAYVTLIVVNRKKISGSYLTMLDSFDFGKYIAMYNTVHLVALHVTFPNTSLRQSLSQL